MGKRPSAASASSGDEELHAAARSGDMKAVQAICSANPLAVNSRDRHSLTSNHRLHLAAWSGHSEIVNYLCKNKADAGAAAMDDMGAIHFAAQKGHLDVVKVLLTSGVSVKASNRKGMTALHYAAQGSNVEFLNYLLKKGANRNTRNKAGKTAVDLASSDEIRKLILEYESSSQKVVSHEKGEEDETKASNVKEVEGPHINADSQGDESAEEGEIECSKRKKEDSVEENQQGAKKSKVALGHLLAEDDMPEAEDEEEEEEEEDQ